MPPRDDSWAHSELHAFEHSCHQDSHNEIRVDACRFQVRPETPARNRAIWTGGDSDTAVLKLRCYCSQKIWSHADIAVTHYHQIIGGFLQHEVEAKNLCIWIWRLSSDKQARRNVRKFLLQFFYDCDCGVIRASHRKQDFKRWIFLPEKRPQVRFKQIVEASKWLQNADRLRRFEPRRYD